MSYQLLASGDFSKLEKIGPHLMLRPSPAAVWPMPKDLPELKAITAHYVRFADGKGEWKTPKHSEQQDFKIKMLDIEILAKFTSFGHFGLFPEQQKNWRRLQQWVKPEEQVLNLFAYTGMASLVCASKGALVTHVDASKTTVAWAKENQQTAGLAEAKIRWLVDDVRRFVAREVRRGSKYQWLILDPPTYGRGNKNEVWKIEEDLPPLLQELKKLTDASFKGILLSSHSPGYSPQALLNLLFVSGFQSGEAITEEMLLPHPELPLPSGTCAWRVDL